MTIRLYVLPVESADDRRGPKYLSRRYDPDPSDNVGETAWTMLSYGLHDWGIAVCRWWAVAMWWTIEALRELYELGKDEGVDHAAEAARMDVVNHARFPDLFPSTEKESRRW